MFEIFSFPFMQNAFIAGFLVAVACGVVGTLTVVSRMSFIAGGVAHASYGGIGIAVLCGFSVLFGALVFATLCGFLVAYLTLKNKERTDSIIGAIWAFGMAVGILALDFSQGYNGDLMGYLFGSILAVPLADIVFMCVANVIILAFIAIFYTQICAVCFDAEFAALRGVRANLFYFVLVGLIAVCVVLTMRVVGLILVIALLTIPPFIAEKFSTNLKQMMLLSAVLSLVFIYAGLTLSYFFDFGAGAAIILLATVTFFVVHVAKG